MSAATKTSECKITTDVQTPIIDETIMQSNIPEQRSHSVSYFEDHRPKPTTRPAIIRVFEDRLVRVTILRRDTINVVRSPTSSATDRLIAFSADLASAAAFFPICSPFGSREARIATTLLVPFPLPKPTAFLHRTEEWYGARGCCADHHAAIPIMMAAVENVMLYKAILSAQKK